MNNIQNINLNWLFCQDFKNEYITAKSYDNFKSVNIPHNGVDIPYDCYDQYMTCKLMSYVKFISLPDNLANKRILIDFEGVSAYYELYVNEKFVGSHKGAYSSQLYDITDFVKSGENKLFLMVDSNERADIPPNGSTVDFLIYSGIYRDVNLFIKDNIFIEKVLFHYELENDNSVSAYPYLYINSTTDSYSCDMNVTITFEGNPFYSYTQRIDIEHGKTIIKTKPHIIPTVNLWDIDKPYLYDISISIDKDTYYTRTGFRSIEAKIDGYYVNNKRVLLTGINRHQSYPYIGYAMGKRAQRKDADLVKEFGFNSVRCSHYMQSKYFLERCDELGLLVFEEIPGWGFIGEENFKEVVMNDVENMVTNHYNHPSIIIWGTRLNESNDDDELYTATNALCKSIDSKRPTTGVRWSTNSNLIEDIYSYNDYTPSHNGDFMLQDQQSVTGLTYKVPYIVSEHVGPLIPCKPWDSEKQIESYAILHARVLNKMRTSNDYMGAFAWCMFDYNTHNDHNSMEKICYHGVMDMFRVPKWPAYLYRSQKDTSEEIIMVPCSMVGRGEREEPVPFYVLTNCDYIEVTLSKDITRRYFPSTKFTGLKHAPIEVIENGEFWQGRWHGAIIVGFVDGKEVVRKTYSNNPRFSDIVVTADDSELFCNTVDETRIVCSFEDENNNRLLYHSGAATISVTGDIELVGPCLLPVRGGTIAFWIKTLAKGNEGIATITIKSDRNDIPEKTISINLIKNTCI